MKTLFTVYDVKPNEIRLHTEVEQDEITEKISNSFDYKFTGFVDTVISVPKFPTEFQIGLIVGSSGSGKSTLAKKFGEMATVHWDNNRSIASHFESFEDASSHFGAVGLNSIPTWLKPYSVLSTGEKFRADMARCLYDGAVIDEFTSVVNRECAVSCSNSISKYIRANGLNNIVFVSCHDDIIDYLQPDWIYDTDKQELTTRRLLRQRPSFVLEVSQCSKQVWSMFAKYHYLSSELNKSADCYIFSYNSLPVAFGAILPMPGRFGDGSDTRKCVSEHRIVVLPDYQGLGIGNRVSEYLAELYLSQGYRYFAKTANPRMGEHRNRSELWRPTCYNQKLKTKRTTLDTITENDISSMMGGANRVSNGGMGRCATVESAMLALVRLCYSHEYLGDENTVIGEHTLNKATNMKRLF